MAVSFSSSSSSPPAAAGEERTGRRGRRKEGKGKDFYGDMREGMMFVEK